MNLRVRRVTGESVSAIFAIVMLRIELSLQVDDEGCRAAVEDR
jgi:hypothetical protein